jgi:hypothetical protein
MTWYLGLSANCFKCALMDSGGLWPASWPGYFRRHRRNNGRPFSLLPFVPSSVPPLDFDATHGSTAILASALFLLFGSGGVVFCRRLTAGLPERVPREPDIGMVSSRTRWLVIATGLVVVVAGWSGFGLYAGFLPLSWL